MFELMAVSHEGLTLETIAAIPMKEVRQPLLQWVDTGARTPIRIAMHGDASVLRKMQQNLSFQGVRTEIRQMKATASGRFDFAQTPAPPPTADTLQPGTPGISSGDSGINEYRKMVREMEERRTSASHVIATSVSGLRPVHIVIGIVIAIIGLLVALASRGGAGG